MSFFFGIHCPILHLAPHLPLSIAVPIGLQDRVLMNAWMHSTRWGSGWGMREWNIYPLPLEKKRLVLCKVK